MMSCKNKNCTVAWNKPKYTFGYCQACINLIHPVKIIRLKHGFNQEDFSKELGVTQGTMSKIETNILTPKINELNILKAKYEIDLNQFIPKLIAFQYKRIKIR